MTSLIEEPDLPGEDRAEPTIDAMPIDADPVGFSAYESSFPARVAAFLRFSPIIEMAQSARRRDWPADTYDIVTLALAAIDMVVARQGLDLEATRDDVVAALRELSYRAAPERPAEEHRQVAAFVIDSLLNRHGRDGPFRYVTSDYTGEDGRHRRREVPFSLLVERDDAVRDENVLRATPDAVNALIGGLDFDVEDEQVATELMLERQLARNAFDSARKSAERARLLSVRLADDLDQVIKQTRRDLRAVEGEWIAAVPERLESARTHIQERLRAERKLLERVHTAFGSEDSAVLTAATRIDALLRECRRRHEELHRRVIGARGVFLDEQERQSFRPPTAIDLPDPHRDVLLPGLELACEDASAMTRRLLTDLCGPHATRLPRLYRLINDLWARPVPRGETGEELEETELIAPSPPSLAPGAIDVAIRAVRGTALPARLSTLIEACHQDAVEPTASVRHVGAEILNLAVLWAYSPETYDEDVAMTDDLAGRVLGPRAAVDTDGTPLRLPGWAGDDVIVAPEQDALAEAAPTPAASHDFPEGFR